MNVIREINVTEDAGALNITVLETANPADDPCEPQKAPFVGYGIGVGHDVGGRFGVAQVT